MTEQDREHPTTSPHRAARSSKVGMALLAVTNLIVIAAVTMLVIAHGRIPQAPAPTAEAPAATDAGSGPTGTSPPEATPTGTAERGGAPSAPATPAELVAGAPLDETAARNPASLTGGSVRGEASPEQPAAGPSPRAQPDPGRVPAPASSGGCAPSIEPHVDPNTGQAWETVLTCPTMPGRVHLGANANTPVGWLDTTSSWLVCYRHGSTHAGGNDIWYYTQGDRAAPGYESRAAWGYLPADLVVAPAHPAPGLPACNPYLWQVDKSQVDYRGRTWSSVWFGHNRPAALVAEPGSPEIIGRLETNTTWFVCFATTPRAGGGQDVWYYTQGDRSEPDHRERHAWGWASADIVVASRHPYDGVPPCE
jgi:hypothetical protein